MKSFDRIAAIDVGTNSFHMVIAQIDQTGLLNTITREKEVVRLGSSSGDMKYILPDAMKRAVNILKTFSQIAKNENATIRAVATSAVREALNREEFIEKVHAATGIEIEVVSGTEEARLINIGVIHALPVYSKKTLVIDIGGGSTETIVSYEGANLHLNSAKLGAIRLTKKYFESGLEHKEAIKQCTEFIKGEWTPALKRISEIGFEYAVGTSGTINTLVNMAFLQNNEVLPAITNGMTVSSKSILEIIDIIKKTKNSEDLLKIPGMDPTRVDIILAGVLIIEYAIKYLNIQELAVSNYALREGIVFDTNQKQKSIEQYHHLSDLRKQTMLNLCNTFQANLVHAEHVKNICIQLFEDLKELHKLNWEEQELLEAAAYLHDIGFYISHDSHHKHSFYLIKNTIMPGFTNNEQEIIANIARYHRKSHPKKKHDNYSLLSDKNQYIVWILAGILRIAEGIDRRQISAVKSVKALVFESFIEIQLFQNDLETSPDIELWGANRRREMLEEKLGKKIFVKIM